MRNKVSNSLFKRGLISFAAAGLLASGAMAAVNISTTTSDYTLNVSKKVPAKGDKIYAIVTLTNADDVVDTLNGSNAQPSITLNSLNGKVCAGKYTDGCPTTASSSATMTTGATVSATTGNFSKGVGIFTIDYTGSKVGTDTITTTGKVSGTNLDTGGVATIALENKTSDITVTEAPNDGTALGVTAIIPSNTSHTNANSGVYDPTTTTGDTQANVLAGDSFKVTIKAYKSSSAGSANFTENQNGPVNVKFIYDSDADYSSTDESTKLTVEASGTMTNGVAEVEVPAEALTKAGTWAIYASAETAYATDDLDYLAETTDGNSSQLQAKTEYVTIKALDASALSASLWRPFILALGDTQQNELNVTVVDAYGNLATTTSSDITFDVVSSTGKIFGSTNTQSAQLMSAGTVSKGVGITGYNGATSSDLAVSTSAPKTTATLTITPKSGITADPVTVNLDLYLYGLAAMVDVDTHSADRNYTAAQLPTSSSGVLTNVEANATKFIVVHKFDSNASNIIKNPHLEAGMYDFNVSGLTSGDDELNITSGMFPATFAGLTSVPDVNHTFLADKSAVISVYLKNDSTGLTSDTITTSPINTVDTVADVNSSPMTFNTTISGGRLVAEVTSTTGNIPIAPYDYRANQGMADVNETNISVSPGAISTFAIGRYINTTNEASLLGNSSTFTEYSTIEAWGLTTATVKNTTTSAGVNQRAKLFLMGENNASASTAESNTSDNVYVLRLTDAKGNKITSSTKSVTVLSTSTSGELSISEVNTSETGASGSPSTNGDSFKVAGGYVQLQYGSTGTDHITLKLQEGFTTITKTYEVTAVDKSKDLDSLTLTSDSDYVLKNSATVINVQALKVSGAAYDFEDGTDKVFSIEISNPNLVEIYEGNTSATVTNGYPNSGILQNGGDVNDTTSTKSDGKTVLFLNAKNTTGSVTVKLKNKAGTIFDSKTINILSTTADFPSPISTISTTEASVNVEQGASTTVTVTVAKENGEVAANEDISVTIDNTSVATVPASITTDENGEATLTVTAGTVISSANITLTTGGISKVLTVNVGEAPTMTISATEASTQAGFQTSVTVTNNAGTPNVSSSDETIATAAYVDGEVVISGVAEGTATITVTDTDETVATITVTVEAGVEPAMTPAIVEGWNLLGNASNDSVDPTSFAGAGETVWTHTTAAGWTELSTIAPSQGFWFKSRTAEAGLEFPMTGDGTGAVEFVAGEWNLLSCGGEKTIADIKAEKTATEVYTYSAGAWSTDDATVVVEGQGYWAK